MNGIQEFAEEYFAAAVDPGPARHDDLFDDSAVVHDDGRTHRGIAAVRTWYAQVPRLRYDLREVSGDPAACRAVAEVTGDSLASPVTFRFVFRRNTRGKITLLDIAPVHTGE